MKEYINQIYYEGLGKTLYLPIEKKIHKIKNKTLKNILKLTTKILYMLFALLIAVILFYTRL